MQFQNIKLACNLDIEEKGPSLLKTEDGEDNNNDSKVYTNANE